MSTENTAADNMHADDAEMMGGHSTDGHAGVEMTETSSGLDQNIAGALSYVLGFLTGLVFFLVEKENDFVRFHAAQSMAVFGGFFVLSIVLSVVGSVATALLFTGTGGFFVGSIISLVLGLVWLAMWVGALVLWAYLMIRAYQGKTPRIPVAAGIADKIAK